MTTPATHHGIIVGVDGSAESKVAVDWAARQAAMHHESLTIVHALNPPAVVAFPEIPMPSGYLEWQQEEGRVLLEQLIPVAQEAASSASQSIQITAEMVSGPVVPALVNLSKEAKLVVVGNRGRGAVARLVLGSVSTGLVHHSHCPVAVIHDHDPTADQPAKSPVVVGIDGSPASELATEIAFKEASLRGVDLVAIHAWSDVGVFEFLGTDWSTFQTLGEQTLSERLSGWQERYPSVTVHRVVVADRPARQLLEQAESAQLVVVGSHGRGGFAGMVLGSVSTAIVQGAGVPVIVARSGS